MAGHLRKRGKTWTYVADLGLKPAQRCDVCGRKGLFWVGAKKLPECPNCGGTLVETLRPRQEWKGGFKTRTEASAALTLVLSKIQEGSHVNASRMTFGAFLTDEWLPGVAGRVRPTTLESYRINVNHHVLPALGSTRLQGLTPGQLNAFYTDLSARGLAPKTVRNIHGIIHKAFDDALKWGRVVRNPADAAEAPRVPGRDMKTWTASQLHAFLEQSEHDRLYAAWRLAAMRGMRRGEILGLRRQDVDLDAGTLSIVQTVVLVNGKPRISEPKTKAGRRRIDLDKATVAAIRATLRRLSEERLAWGPAYMDSGLIFTLEDGSGVHPERFVDRFLALGKAADLPRIRFHDLRHSCASVALAAGLHPKVVQEMLGHSSISITLDTYSHLIPSMQRDAAERIAAIIGA